METHLPPWQLLIPACSYLLLCAFATVGLRCLFSAFRACAIMRGDFPDSDKEPGKDWHFWQAFWESFKGFSQSKAHADLWLNAFIGFFELAAYPILLKTETYSIIGGWLIIRTAGNWGGWSVSRTSYNRYLLNIILELAIAYFWLARYVQVLPKAAGLS
jgi:hypothetical protein